MAEAPATLRNALAGKTQAPVRARVRQAFLGEAYALLEVTDDDAGEAWVVAPALASTPTAALTIGDYVAIDASTAGLATERVPPGLAHVSKVLLAADVVGPDVTLGVAGDGAVLDPHLPLPDVPGLKPVEVQPIGPRIAELHQRRLDLAGTTVRLRAQAWRIIPRVGGLHWVWLRDGSAEGRRGMVLMGVREAIEPGAVIEAQAVLTADRLLGGHLHALVLEPARLLPVGVPAAATPTEATQPTPVSPR